MRFPKYSGGATPTCSFHFHSRPPAPFLAPGSCFGCHRLESACPVGVGSGIWAPCPTYPGSLVDGRGVICGKERPLTCMMTSFLILCDLLLPTLSPVVTRRTVLTLLKTIGVDHHSLLLPGAPAEPGSSATQHSFSPESSQPPMISLNNLGRPPPSTAPCSLLSSWFPASQIRGPKRNGPQRGSLWNELEGGWAGFISLWRQPAAHRARRPVGPWLTSHGPFSWEGAWTQVSGLGTPWHPGGGCFHGLCVTPGCSGRAVRSTVGVQGPWPSGFNKECFCYAAESARLRPVCSPRPFL